LSRVPAARGRISAHHITHKHGGLGESLLPSSHTGASHYLCLSKGPSRKPVAFLYTQKRFFLIQGPWPKPGAFLYTRKRLSLFISHTHAFSQTPQHDVCPPPYHGIEAEVRGEVHRGAAPGPLQVHGAADGPGVPQSQGRSCICF
jgi:hypothetical protein